MIVLNFDQLEQYSDSTAFIRKLDRIVDKVDQDLEVASRVSIDALKEYFVVLG